MNKKKGFEYCALCDTESHISDPQISVIDAKKQICRECWRYVGSQTSWQTIHVPMIVFDYVKVPISHQIKWKVWKRDNFTCQDCGTQDNLSVDHKTPESYGGTLEMDNLQTLCRGCNSKKSNIL